jgi:hypothetical protein
MGIDALNAAARAAGFAMALSEEVAEEAPSKSTNAGPGEREVPRYAAHEETSSLSSRVTGFLDSLWPKATA